jgi:hypothetical protein
MEDKIKKISELAPGISKMGKAMGIKNVNEHISKKCNNGGDNNFDIESEISKLGSTYVRSESQLKFIKEWHDKVIEILKSSSLNTQIDVKAVTGAGKTLFVLKRYDLMFKFLFKMNKNGVGFVLTNNDRLSKDLISRLDEFRFDLDISDDFTIKTEADLLLDGEVKNNSFYVISINKLRINDKSGRILRKGGLFDNMIKDYRNSYPGAVIDVTMDEGHLNTSKLSQDVVGLFGSNRVILSVLTATPLDFKFFSENVASTSFPRIELPMSNSVDDGFNKKTLKRDLPDGLEYEKKYSEYLKYRHLIRGILIHEHLEESLKSNNISGITLAHLAKCPHTYKDDMYEIAKNIFGYKENQIAHIFNGDTSDNFDESITNINSDVKLILFDRILQTGYNLPRASILSVSGYENFTSEADNTQLGGRVNRTFSPALINKFPFLNEIEALNTGYIFAEEGFDAFLDKESSDFYLSNSRIKKNVENDAEMICELVNSEPDALILTGMTTYTKPRLYNDIENSANFIEHVDEFFVNNLSLCNPIDDSTKLEVNKSMFKTLDFNTDDEYITKPVRVGDVYDNYTGLIIEGKEEKSFLSDVEMLKAVKPHIKSIVDKIGHYTGLDRTTRTFIVAMSGLFSRYLGIKGKNKQKNLLLSNLQNSQNFRKFCSDLLKTYIPKNEMDLMLKRRLKGIDYKDISEAREKNEGEFKMARVTEYPSSRYIDKKGYFHKVITDKLLFSINEDGFIVNNSGYETEMRFLEDMHTRAFSEVKHIYKNGFDKKEFIRVLYEFKKILRTYSPDYVLSDGKRIFLLDVKGDKDRMDGEFSEVKLKELLEYGKREERKRSDGVKIIPGFLYYENGTIMFRYGVDEDNVIEFYKFFQ